MLISAAVTPSPPFGSRRTSLLTVSAAFAALTACAPSETPPPPVAPTPAVAVITPPLVDAGTTPLVHVQILAFNDFHGHLLPPSGTNGIIVAPTNDPIASLPGTKVLEDAGVALVPAGGAAYLAARVASLRAQNPNTVVVSAGDLTGASPMVSNLLKDEPAIAVMNAIGLDYEAVGNHDFDRGIAELTRLVHGECDGGDCDAGAGWSGAKFTYLAANVTNTATQKTVFPSYAIREFGDGDTKVRVAFIGETLKGTPGRGLGAEADEGTQLSPTKRATANALVPELKAAGVSAIVLLLHQGGSSTRGGGTYDSCVGARRRRRRGCSTSSIPRSKSS